MSGCRRPSCQQIDGFDQAGVRKGRTDLMKTQVTVEDCGSRPLLIAAACWRCNSSNLLISPGATGNGMMRTAITSSSSRTAKSPALPTASIRAPSLRDWECARQALFFPIQQRRPHIAAMSVKQITEILLDQPFSRMTPPEHDVFSMLRAMTSAAAGSRTVGQYLAPTGHIHRQRPDRRRFCSWYPACLSGFRPCRPIGKRRLTAQPGGQAKIFDCDDNIAKLYCKQFWPSYGPSQ